MTPQATQGMVPADPTSNSDYKDTTYQLGHNVIPDNEQEQG